MSDSENDDDQSLTTTRDYVLDVSPEALKKVFRYHHCIMKLYGFQDRFYKRIFRSLLIYDLVSGPTGLMMALFGFWIVSPRKRIQLSVSTPFRTTLQRTTTIRLRKVKSSAVESENPINGSGIK